MKWDRSKLWGGIIRWGCEGDSVVVRRSDNPELDPVPLKMQRISENRLMRRVPRYAHYDGILFVSDEQPSVASRSSEMLMLVGRIAQHIHDCEYTLTVPTDELDGRDETDASPHLGLGLVSRAVIAEGDNGLLCKAEDWSYHEWRKACALVERSLAQRDSTYGMNRARSSIVAVMPGPWFQAIRRDLSRELPPGPHPFPFQPSAYEAQGMGDAFVYVSNAVDTPVILPVGGVHLMRSVALPGAGLRVLALPSPWRLACGLKIVDAALTEDAPPSFDADTFAARRKARRAAKHL